MLCGQSELGQAVPLHLSTHQEKLLNDILGLTRFNSASQGDNSNLCSD